MTSVKELGETLRKRQAAVEGAEATETAMLGAVGSAYAILLVTGGCLVLALGAGMASVGVFAPDMAWMAESLENMGITSGAVLAAGLSLLGLGLVAKELAQAQRAMLGAIRRTGGSSQLAESQEEIRESLGKVHFALRVLQESTKSLLEASHEHSYKREESDQGDAVYRLAASLDQLGLRLEDRLDSQQSGLEQRLGSLDEALEETRRRMADWVDLLPDLAALGAARDGADSDHDEDEDEAPPAPRSKRSRRPAERRRRDEARGENGRGDHEGDDEPLEVVVTLEDRPERDGRGTPLGMLDVLDDFGQGLGPDDEGGPADSSFLFDPQLSARLEELGELEDDEDDDAAGAETQAKLAQLQSLLSDARLRRALDGLRDAGGKKR